MEVKMPVKEIMTRDVVTIDIKNDVLHLAQKMLVYDVGSVIVTDKKQPVIHTTVGKVSQNTKELEENVTAVFNALDKKQILKAYIKSTMSPSIKLTV